MKKTSTLYEKLICLSFACLIFVGLESGTCLIFSSAERIERILNVLQQDSVLFWRQRSYLDTLFEGVQVKTNNFGFRNDVIKIKKKETCRIICLGASPTFGWGVNQKDTYSYRLEHLIRKNILQKQNFEVINAGMIGYSSYQGILLLRKTIIDLKPDIITVSYVINDVDKYRFYRNSDFPDNQLKNKNRILVGIENVLQRSKFVSVLKKIIIKFQRTKALNGLENGRWAYRKQTRVSEHAYKQNLKAIVDLAKANKIKVIFLKLPVNLPVNEEVKNGLQISSKKAIIKGINFIQNGDLPKAILMFNKAVSDNPFNSEACYYLGLCYEQLGDIEESGKYFQKQKENELFECSKLAKKYNAIMEKIAEEEAVGLVDLVSEFAEFTLNNERYLFLDPNHDTIHPNNIGHSIIAGGIFDYLRNNCIINN